MLRIRFHCFYRTMSTLAKQKPNEEWKRFYQENGYLVIKDAIPKKDLQALQTEIGGIARGRYGSLQGLEAIDDQSKVTDDEVISRYLAFHHPHKISKVLLDVLCHSGIVNVLTSIVGPNVKCMQSMYFVKGPGKPGQAWHQDENYIPTRDRSLVGAWLAIDDADIKNGCLWMLPGSHKTGVLYPMKIHNDTRFDPSGEAYNFPYPRESGIPVEVPAGTVVFFNGYVLHRSLQNSSARFRRAYVGHYMSAESYLPWDCDGSIPLVADNRDVFMVAGEDPYKERGYVTNLTFPFIRPAKGTGTVGGALKIKVDDLV